MQWYDLYSKVQSKPLLKYWDNLLHVNWRPKTKSLVTFFIRSNKKTQVYLTYFEKALKILFLFFDVNSN